MTHAEKDTHKGAGLEQIADVAALIEKLRATSQLMDGIFIAVLGKQLPDM
jgi:hypothetical protein